MSVITECLIAPAMTATTAAVVSRIIEPEPLTSSGVAVTALTTHFYALLGASAVAGNSIESNFFVNLLGATGAADNVVFSHAIATDLLGARGVAGNEAFLRVSDLAGVAAAAANDRLEGPLRTLINVQAHALNTVLPGLVLADFVVVRANAATAISKIYRELVAVTAHADAAIIPGLRVVDLLGAAGVVALSVLDRRTTRDLLATLSHAAVQLFDRNLAADLVDNDACVAVSVLDTMASGAWTAPIDSFAMSRYVMAVHLNSLAADGDTLLLFGHDGAFKRAGLTDDGVPIDAMARTGLQTFDDVKLKRPDNFYLAYKSTTPVRVDLGETRSGTERTYTYTAPARSTEVTATTAARVKLGQGIESLEFRFTIRNTAGGSMSVRGCNFMYLSMARRF